MRFWPHKAEEDVPIEISKEALDKYYENGGASIPPEPPKDPEPDLSTKPDDVIGYCFGYACPKKHVFEFFDSITLDGYNIRKPCPTCGGISKPAVIKRTAEAQWGDKAYPFFGYLPPPNWGWFNTYTSGIGRNLFGYSDGVLWTKHEFVHFLDSPRKPAKRKRK